MLNNLNVKPSVVAEWKGSRKTECSKHFTHKHHKWQSSTQVIRFQSCFPKWKPTNPRKKHTTLKSPPGTSWTMPSWWSTTENSKSTLWLGKIDYENWLHNFITYIFLSFSLAETEGLERILPKSHPFPSPDIKLTYRP